MPNRSRLSFAALGMLVVAVLPTDVAGRPPGPSAGVQIQAARTYRGPDCDNLKSQNEADYCIQAQIAEATKAQVEVAIDQMWFTAFEALILLLTVFFSYRATKQASGAAKDSKQGVKLAAQSAASSAKMAQAMNEWVEVFHAAVRAHVLVTASAYDLQERSIYDQVAMTAGSSDAKIIGSFRYEVTGATAARFSEVSVELTWGPPSTKPVYGGELLAPGEGIWNRPPESKIQIFPVHSKRSMTPEEARHVLEKSLFVWMYGRIVYLDLMGKSHVTPFCRRLNVDTQDFELGPDKYNRST